MNTVKNNLFIKNRNKLKSKLSSSDMVAVLTSNSEMPRSGDTNFPYRQNSNLLYLTGINQKDTILLLYSDSGSGSVNETLFIKENNKTTAFWEGVGLSQEEAYEISGVEEIRFFSEFEKIFRRIMQSTHTVYLDSCEYYAWQNGIRPKALQFIDFCKNNYPLHQYKSLSPLLMDLRTIKSDLEVEHIRKSCEITKKGFKRVIPLIRDGLYEYEIEAELAYEFRKNNATFAYEPIVASDSNNNVLHYTSNKARLKSDTLVLIDAAAEYVSYASDVTRVFPVNGKFTAYQKKIYKAVLRVLNSAVANIAIGTSFSSFSNYIQDLIKDELEHLGLINQFYSNKKLARKDCAKYFMHSPIHHVGLDVHDWCNQNIVFEPNMVIAIEPAIYLTDEKFGVRLENVYLIKSDSVENLTAEIPINVDEIESLMKI